MSWILDKKIVKKKKICKTFFYFNLRRGESKNQNNKTKKKSKVLNIQKNDWI